MDIFVYMDLTKVMKISSESLFGGCKHHPTALMMIFIIIMGFAVIGTFSETLITEKEIGKFVCVFFCTLYIFSLLWFMNYHHLLSCIHPTTFVVMRMKPAKQNVEHC